MKILMMIIVAVLALLSIAAGVPKLIQMPQELGFLQAIGMNGVLVSLLGGVQVLGGALLTWPKARFVGSGLVALGFLVSSLALFAGENVPFAFVSTIPLALAFALLIKFYPSASNNQEATTNDA